MGFHGGNWWSYIRYDEEQDRPQVTPELLRRVWQYARPYLGGIVVILLSILVVSALSLLPPLLIRDLIDHAVPARDIARLNWLALGMILVPVVNGLVGVGQRFYSARIGEGIIFDLRRDLYEHLQRMSLRFFTHTHAGELMSRLNNDVIGAQRAVTGTLITMISNFFSLVATLAVMISLEWRLTLLGIAVLPLFVIPARRIGRVLRGVTRQSLDLNAAMNAMMNETLNISGALLMKLFGRSRDEVQRFTERAADVRDVGIKQALIGRWFFLAIGIVSAVGTALVFWLGGHMVLQGIFSIGTIVAFSAYLRDLYGPLMALSNARVEFATSMVSFERVFEAFDLPREISERADPRVLDGIRGQVAFKDVCFSYMGEDGKPIGLEEVRRFGWDAKYRMPVKGRNGGKDQPEAASLDSEPNYALQDISFEIEPGKVAALVGPSGAGKTTITYLLPRLYDPTSGEVLLDGVNLRDLSLDGLAAHIGMVTQETYLFHASIKENLLYAKPDAAEEELEAACRAANIHDFIIGLEDGYETVVGERGYRLSGGEKQRVSIARVILKDPQVLILDEATSHLDSQSEALIQQAMQEVMKGRTSLVIAHRLSTVIGADQILVLDNGRLIEQGVHEELLALGGLYAQLFETQFGVPNP